MLKFNPPAEPPDFDAKARQPGNKSFVFYIVADNPSSIPMIAGLSD
ncbi:hypothetical protein PN483_01730 [Nodularia spumigena CS-591/04]|nr:hypothetical protein [Nodularia spumigena]MDB9322536.1 hypothetical protein [Nodularia spumigena CS-591/07A]MDB9329236.1 hypothetical protein [Nodularia spumigena CS-591/04]